MSVALEQSTASRTAVWRALTAGFCASLVGIGLARFAYTPLLPAIIDAHWFDASTAAYLGAANLVGYLIGALVGRPLARRFTNPWALRAMMLLATTAFFACAQPVSFPWFFAWRLLAGISGGALMVLAAPTVLPLVPAARRGFAAGVIFTGVGVGVVISGTLVPLLLHHGLAQTWTGLGVLSLLLTVIAWTGWPVHTPAPAVAQLESQARPRTKPLRPLYIEYGLNAASWVPHMIFLVDYVVHGLGQGFQAGAVYWVLFGVGATVGPVLAGILADLVGFGRALRIAFVIEVFAVVTPATPLGTAWLMASSVIVGAFVTGTVPLVLGRIHELLPDQPDAQNAAWKTATVGFAVCQALAAYSLSYVFSHSGGNYRLLFSMGTAAIIAALTLELVTAAKTPRSTHH